MLMLLKHIVEMTEWLNLPSLIWSHVPRTARAAASYLHPGLGQVDLHGQLLPSEHVRVVSLGKDSLQSLQLHGHKKQFYFKLTLVLGPHHFMLFKNVKP